MDEFKKGTLIHHVKTISFEELSAEIKPLVEWDGGYFGFSNRDLTLKDLLKNESLFLEQRVEENAFGVSGYLQEIGLWRKHDGKFEEIYAERNDRGFLFERWVLYEKEIENEGIPCYFRKAYISTFPKSVLKGENLEAIEVIVPDYRLSIYITVSESKDERRQG